MSAADCSAWEGQQEEQEEDRKYYSDDQLHPDMTGGACSTYGGEEKFIEGFGGES
jgi:hypothetical protein